MKKNKVLLIFSLILILIVSVACQNETVEPEDTDQPDQVTPDNNEDVDGENNSDDEELGDDSEVNGDNEVEEIPEDEEKEPLYQINQENSAVEPIDDANKQVVLITIDDVPDKNGLEMAHILKGLEAPAIFFVNGHFIQTEEKQDELREIHEMGFAIGNHTYSHPNLGEISEEEQRKEIVELNDLIEEVIGERPKFFRAPHGVNTDYSRQVVEEEGMTLMNWSYGYDYFTPYMDKEKLTEAMITGEGPEAGVDYSLLKPGANLLMHDREWTKEALADIITGLRDQGYETVDPDLILTPTE